MRNAGEVNFSIQGHHTAGRAIEQGFGKRPVFNREGGSIPVVSTFQEELGVPCVLFGVGLPDENAHAPDEKLDLGNFHGGVVSAGLDAMGGLACLAAVGGRHMDESPEARLQRFAKLGTIDLRIDYLRPAIGDHFELRAEVLRLGSRVGSTRMEFLGPDGKLLSTGAGAYIIS